MQTVTESNAVVIDAQDELYIFVQIGSELVGHILAMQLFARDHIVFIVNCANKFEISQFILASKTQVGYFQHILSFVSNKIIATVGADKTNCSIGRDNGWNIRRASGSKKTYRRDAQ